MFPSNGHIGQSVVGGYFASDATSVSRRHQTVKHGDILFQDGDRRITAFRVTEGALCHYMVWPDGSHDVIEFVFPGDIVGLGSLPDHISTAQAMVDTGVEWLTEAEVAELLQNDAALAARLASCADREFEFVRRRALGSGHRTPVQRLASYILAVAHVSCRSGESAATVADITGSPALANLLEIDQDELTTALADLEARGLVTADSAGLVVNDRIALEALADS